MMALGLGESCMVFNGELCWLNLPDISALLLVLLFVYVGWSQGWCHNNVMS